MVIEPKWIRELKILFLLVILYAVLKICIRKIVNISKCSIFEDRYYKVMCGVKLRIVKKYSISTIHTNSQQIETKARRKRGERCFHDMRATPFDATAAAVTALLGTITKHTKPKQENIVSHCSTSLIFSG